jgi:phosphatidylglycerophosphatase A
MSDATSRFARRLATWFGCGLVPVAPGTAGSVGALPVYLVAVLGGRAVVLAAAVLVTAVGVWAATLVERESRTKDPQEVVIDEVAGMLITLLPVAAPSWQSVGAGFVIFRILDSLKPWPVRDFEKLPSGWGIVFDDVAAGILGAVILEGMGAIGWLRLA